VSAVVVLFNQIANVNDAMRVNVNGDRLSIPEEYFSALTDSARRAVDCRLYRVAANEEDPGAEKAI